MQNASTLNLFNAARLNQAKQIDSLLGAGADLASVDANGQTPLMHAAKHGSTLSVIYLLEAGAEPLTIDANGQTALHLACEHGQERAAIHLYYNGGFTENPDSSGMTILDHVAATQHGDIAKNPTALLGALSHNWSDDGLVNTLTKWQKWSDDASQADHAGGAARPVPNPQAIAELLLAKEIREQAKRLGFNSRQPCVPKARFHS